MMPTDGRRRHRAGLSRAVLLAAGLAIGGWARGQAVVVDFDAYPVGSGNSMNFLPLPKTDSGLRLSGSSSQSFVGLPGPQHCGWVGMRSFYPQPGSGGAARTFEMDSVSGDRFTVKSLVLRPYCGASGGTVTFTAVSGSSTFTQNATVPTATTGTVVSFGANFEAITAFRWTTSGQNLHQISDLTVEFIPQAVAAAPMTVSEAAGSVQVPLRLTFARSVATTFNYQLLDGTAAIGTDYQNAAGGTGAAGMLVIPAGDTVATLTIPILNDTVTESPETFTVAFTSPAGSPVTLPTNSTTVTIGSDDGVNNFAGWMTAHALTGNAALPDADPNGDGASNIESWLCRLNPAGPSPTAWMERRATYFVTAANVPGLRLVVPAPLPADVRMIFEESTLLGSWSEQTRRSGFATGSLWTGSGASRVVESNSLSARTITLPGSASRSARSRAFFRMKYELVSGGGD